MEYLIAWGALFILIWCGSELSSLRRFVERFDKQGLDWENPNLDKEKGDK